MTIARIGQSTKELIARILQGNQPPAEKLVQIEDRHRELVAELEAQRAKAPTFLLERELVDIEQARVALLPQVKAAEKAAHQEKHSAWEQRVEAGFGRIAAKLLETQAEIDATARECAAFPRPSAGEPQVYAYDTELYDAADGVVRSGEAIHKFDRASGDRPRLAPKSQDAPQVWGEPLGLQKK